MGLRAGLDWCGKSRPTGIRSPDRPARRQLLYRLSYPAHRERFITSINESVVKNNFDITDLYTARYDVLAAVLTKTRAFRDAMPYRLVTLRTY